MPRMLDLRCPCGFELRDFFVMRVPERIVHFDCGQEMEQMVFSRPPTQPWDSRDAVVVFRDPATGKIRYPGRNDAPTPAGFERVEMRSLREVERFEREHHVRNEAMWYDRNGRGFDDTFRGRKL